MASTRPPTVWLVIGPMRSAFWKKLLNLYRERRFWSVLRARLFPYLRGLKYIIFNPAAPLISIHCPKFIEPDKRERPTVERIFEAFKKMKVDQRKASALYQPSSLWQEQLQSAYVSLDTAAESGNLDEFHYFLANFGAWKHYTGVEESTLIRRYAVLSPTRRYLQNEVFLNLLKLWNHYYQGLKPVQRLVRPNYGNLSGAYVDGVLVTVDSFFGEIYGTLLSGLLHGTKRPIIAELGGGGGRLAYYTLRDKDAFVYLDFDLPETLCLASYHLMLAFPSKRVLLYGEAGYSHELHEKYDFLFMPSFEMAKLQPSSVDLFINECSLGEMTPQATAQYVACIVRATRYFFHMNHERFRNKYSDGRQSLLGCEYPVPQDQFTLLFRYPDLKHLLFLNGSADFNSDTFVYLYERTARPSDC